MVELIVWLPLILIILLPAGLLGRSALRARRRSRARLSGDGTQEIEVLVLGGFKPSTVIVKSGIPARLYFNRQEDCPCSQRVILSGPRQERHLTPFATTPVQFIPTRPGEYMFTCSMGLYRGRLIVEE